MSPQKDVFASKEEKSDFIIALIVIVLFTVFIFFFFFKTEEVEVIDTLNQPEIESIITKNIIEEEDQSTFTENSKNKVESNEIEKTNKTDIEYETITSEDIKTIPVVINSASQPILTDSISKTISTNLNNAKPRETQLDTLDNKTLTISDLKIEVKDTITTIQEASIEQEEELSKTIPVQTKEEIKVEQKTSNNTFDCIIVVGVFEKESNRKAIINKLVSLGYTHSEGALRKGLNYVGVPISCNDKQGKRKLLRDLNKAFDVTSWVKKI